MSLIPKDPQQSGDADLEAYSPSVGSAPAPAPRAAAAPAPAKAEAPGGGGGLSLSGLRVSLMPSDLEGKEAPDLVRGLLILGLALVVETIIIGGAYFFVSRDVDQRSAQRDQLQAQIADLDKTVEKEEATAKEAAAYQGQINAAKEALDKHQYWTKFFAFLEKETRPTIKYMNFSGDSDSGVVTLDARGQTFRDVAEQIIALREQPMVEDVRTSSASAMVSATGEIQGVSFTMIIKFKPEIWTGGPAAVAAAPSTGSSSTQPASTQGAGGAVQPATGEGATVPNPPTGGTVPSGSPDLLTPPAPPAQ